MHSFVQTTIMCIKFLQRLAKQSRSSQILTANGLSSHFEITNGVAMNHTRTN